MNHLSAHVAVDLLENGPLDEPCIALLVSGGHSSILQVPRVGGLELTELGATLDDAAGEAFDKVARLLGLGFPGGPLIDRAARDGDPAAIALPARADRRRTTRPFAFSFSGLKTAVARWVEARERAGEPVPVADVAASLPGGGGRRADAPRRSGRPPRPASTTCCSAAGWRPTPGCARWPPQRCERAGHPAAGAAAGPVHRQRRDGRRARRAAGRARRAAVRPLDIAADSVHADRRRAGGCDDVTMWEVRAADGRLAELLAWVLARTRPRRPRSTAARGRARGWW